jgi:hypothetical protein
MQSELVVLGDCGTKYRTAWHRSNALMPNDQNVPLSLARAISKDIGGDVSADRGFQLGEDVPSAPEVGATRRVSIARTALFPEKPFLLVNLRLHPT